MMSSQLFPEMFQVTEIEINYRNPVPHQDRVKINTPSMAYQVFNSTWDKSKIELVEQSKILLLNHANYCLGIVNLSVGTLTSCPLDSRMIFSVALKANATAFVLAHNHPSSDPTPSLDDTTATKNIVKAGKLFGIAMMDHLILTSHGYFSFVENKVLPK